MEVYFLDVGQGTSQVILLGKREALVIDCGERDVPLVHLLKDAKVDCIARLIVTHSHDDHSGGAETILSDYQGRIEKVCFLQDDKFLDSAFWRRIKKQLEDGDLLFEQLERLERGKRPKLLYENTALELKLKLYAPLIGQNLLAQAQGKPNATSAVVVLAVGKKTIVFAADSTMEQWRQIRAGSGRPLDCHILAVSHHAGRIDADPKELAWLFSEGVRPRHAVISVGTSNTDGHPRERRHYDHVHPDHREVPRQSRIPSARRSATAEVDRPLYAWAGLYVFREQPQRCVCRDRFGPGFSCQTRH